MQTTMQVGLQSVSVPFRSKELVIEADNGDFIFVGLHPGILLVRQAGRNCNITLFYEEGKLERSPRQKASLEPTGYTYGHTRGARITSVSL